MIEAVVFDMDGLLVDSEPLWQEAEIEIFGALGLHLDRAACLRTRGRKIDEVVAHWYAEAPWSGPSPAAVRDAIVGRVAALVRDRGRAKPGVDHALDFFAARQLPLAVASSSPYAVIDAVLERLDAGRRFAALHSGEEERFGKPHPAIFLGAARKLGVAPTRCLAFEDSPAGVAAARAAGMRCVAVPDPGAGGGSVAAPERARLAAAADVLIPSLLEVDRALWRRVAGANRGRDERGGSGAASDDRSHDRGPDDDAPSGEVPDGASEEVPLSSYSPTEDARQYHRRSGA